MGLGMTAVRVSKCHPFHPGGYDPVPTDQQLSTVEEGI
jgi:putative component of membrane protein insertase Oxa1/YidC/SpoIIIJ protein YidD